MKLNLCRLKLIVPSLALACAVAGGCGSANKKAAKASAVPPLNQAAMNVPATPPPAPPAAFTPAAPPQPVVYDAPAEQPVVEEAVIDASDTAAAAAPAPKPRAARKTTASAGGTKYKVKKGESLWSIAQARYGNGNKWKAIAAANPKINPDRVQAGQTIVLP